MAQTPNSNMNTNIFSDLSTIINDNKVNSTEMERGKKRPAPLSPEAQAKKKMVDHHSCKEKPLNVIAKATDQPKFISAAEVAIKTHTNIQAMPEISDEEFLMMALEFEKKHPQ